MSKISNASLQKQLSEDSGGGFMKASKMFEEVEHFKVSSWAELSDHL